MPELDFRLFSGDGAGLRSCSILPRIVVKLRDRAEPPWKMSLRRTALVSAASDVAAAFDLLGETNQTLSDVAKAYRGSDLAAGVAVEHGNHARLWPSTSAASHAAEDSSRPCVEKAQQVVGLDRSERYVRQRTECHISCVYCPPQFQLEHPLRVKEVKTMRTPKTLLCALMLAVSVVRPVAAAGQTDLYGGIGRGSPLNPGACDYH